MREIVYNGMQTQEWGTSETLAQHAPNVSRQTFWIVNEYSLK